MDIEKPHMRIKSRHALQLDGMRMMMRTILHADQRNRHVRPRLAQELEFEFVHVCGFAVQEDEEGELGHGGGGLPAEDRVEAPVTVARVLVLEVGVFDDLPALHHLCAAAQAHFRVPVLPEVGRGELPDVGAPAGECYRVDAASVRVLALGAGDHVVQDAVDEVFDEADVGGLVVVAVHAVGAADAAVGVPGHGAGDVD